MKSKEKNPRHALTAKDETEKQNRVLKRKEKSNACINSQGRNKTMSDEAGKL